MIMKSSDLHQASQIIWKTNMSLSNVLSFIGKTEQRQILMKINAVITQLRFSVSDNEKGYL